MEPQQLIKFCPNCKEKLSLEKAIRFHCASCGYIQYISPVPCNSLIITNLAKEILLVERKNEPRAGFWDLPGGFIDIGENIEASVIREAKEEVNLDFKPVDLHYISSNFMRYPYKGINEHLLNISYHAFLPAGQVVKAGDDAKSAQFFQASEIPWAMIAFPSVANMIKTFLKNPESYS